VSLAADWRLSMTHESAGGAVAYEVLGDGPPVVLVHGTPSWSYLWRDVAGGLAERFTVYVCDLLGYGTSEKREGQDVSIAAQTRMLVELLELWELDGPCIAGHDIGGAITLRLMLLERRRFHRVALCDAVAIAPWITPFSRHVQRHLEAFQTVPEHIHRELIAAHLRTAIARDMSDAELEPYLRPWLGPVGQAAYYRQVAQFDERYTREIEPCYGEIRTPRSCSGESRTAGSHPSSANAWSRRSPAHATCGWRAADTSSPKTSPDPWPKRWLPSSQPDGPPPCAAIDADDERLGSDVHWRRGRRSPSFASSAGEGDEAAPVTVVIERQIGGRRRRRPQAQGGAPARRRLRIRRVPLPRAHLAPGRSLGGELVAGPPHDHGQAQNRPQPCRSGSSSAAWPRHDASWSRPT
jgi:pimeloyl-ACP methyl ester carboxylesterase